jgi:hypothetical protein
LIACIFPIRAKIIDAKIIDHVRRGLGHHAGGGLNLLHPVFFSELPWLTRHSVRERSAVGKLDDFVELTLPALARVLPCTSASKVNAGI